MFPQGLELSTAHYSTGWAHGSPEGNISRSKRVTWRTRKDHKDCFQKLTPRLHSKVTGFQMLLQEVT